MREKEEGKEDSWKRSRRVRLAGVTDSLASGVSSFCSVDVYSVLVYPPYVRLAKVSLLAMSMLLVVRMEELCACWGVCCPPDTGCKFETDSFPSLIERERERKSLCSN